MAIPSLQAALPARVPAKVYDKIWVEEVIISAPDPNGDAAARVRLRKFALVDGKAELEPTPGDWLHVSDLLANSESDADLAQVVTSLMAYIAKVGIAQGVISDPNAPADEPVVDPADEPGTDPA